MNLKQCPACQGSVDALKAYCPDCGAPMEEELERNGSSEFDSMMRTQNISRTTQFRLMEDFNLSAVFNTKDINEASGRGSDTTQFSTNARTETQNGQRKTESVILQPQVETVAAVRKTETNSNSGKKAYIFVGIGLAVFALLLIAAIVGGILFWNYLR